VSLILVGGWDALPVGAKSEIEGEYCSIADAENFMQKDRFAEHKRQYEFHAAAWLDARARGDRKLSRKSAQQMLRHLQKMYRLALSSRS